MKAYFRRIRLARDLKCLGFGQVQTKGREVPMELEISRLPPAPGSKLHFFPGWMGILEFPKGPNNSSLCLLSPSPLFLCCGIM